jgi:hypothetical protein
VLRGDHGGVEVRDILEAIMAASRVSYPARLCRAHRLLELAINDFFDVEDDVAALVIVVPEQLPFPAA